MISDIRKEKLKNGDFRYVDQDGRTLRTSAREYAYGAWHNHRVVSKYEITDDRAFVSFHITRSSAEKKKGLILFRIQER